MEDFQKQIDDLKSQVADLNKSKNKDKISLLVFSNSMDKLLAALIIATGAAAMGSEVVMFFTFWGTSALRKKKKIKKNFLSKMFGMMLPVGIKDVSLSQMNMAGMGTEMMKHVMKKKNISSLEDLLEIADEMEVKINVCEMSMDLMGLKKEEMIKYSNIEFCGVAKFLADADDSQTTMFI